MIIISKHTNQLCNRLFTYLPVLSYAIEANEKVVFLFQYKGYNNYFPNLEKENIRSFCPDNSIKESIISKITNTVIRLADKAVHLILRPGEKIPLKKPLGILFNPKWKEIRYDKAYIEKHAERIKFLFAPSEETQNKISAMMGETNSITVGVHMRAGDYRTYKNGKYFYTQEQYAAFMAQIKNELSAQGKKARFLLCSNEKIDKNIFSEFDIITQDGTDMLIDLYALAKCDYIIGAPSTYSQWASFYGNAPLCPIENAGQQIKLENFGIITSLDTFNPIKQNEQ